jgi:Zn-finger nucleic acid-binding protein
MECPRCDKALQENTVGSVQVKECSACKGIWFEKEDQLRQAKDETDPDLNWMDFDIWKHPERFRISTAPLKCPACSQGMIDIRYDTTAVVVDHCIHCRGLWLDGGEFAEIIEELTRELVRKSELEYLRETLEEARAIITGPENFLSEWRDFRTVLRMLQFRFFVDNPKVVNTIMAIQRHSPIR